MEKQVTSMNDDPWAALERAIALAIKSHAGQRDKGGKPYILHLLRVMHSVTDPIAMQAAVLHDYIEDVGGSQQEMTKHDISPQAIESVVRLTRTEHCSYCQYIIDLSADPIATAVKLADIEDNYRIERVAYRSDHQSEDAKRIQKYALTHQFLTSSIDQPEYQLRMVALEDTIGSTP
jgi:(p)ppGpp synthase/HD superfamily hydrolase